jgi:hypothetical protein
VYTTENTPAGVHSGILYLTFSARETQVNIDYFINNYFLLNWRAGDLDVEGVRANAWGRKPDVS